MTKCDLVWDFKPNFGFEVDTLILRNKQNTVLCFCKKLNICIWISPAKNVIIDLDHLGICLRDTRVSLFSNKILSENGGTSIKSVLANREYICRANSRRPFKSIKRQDAKKKKSNDKNITAITILNTKHLHCLNWVKTEPLRKELLVKYRLKGVLLKQELT